ncbi:hypothetical protein Vafri_2394 [Volvox africanus]|nr:hypothetical protein Vafri_2394 [Volvox africanus]
MGAVMTVCELQAYGASAFEMRLVPAPSPSPAPMPPLPPSLSPEPSTSPPPPHAPLKPPSPSPASSPSRLDKGRGSSVVLAGKVSTNPTAVTAVTASIVAVSIGTTVTATMVASAAAAATAATAVGSAGGVIATSGASSAAATGAAGAGGALAFVGHMQFFALTANAAANTSAGYKDTNSQLSWLNLQFNTLRSVDLPDAEQQAYSQVLNIAIAFFGVLLLHLMLVLLLSAVRKRIQRRREAAAAAARKGTDAVGMPAPALSFPSLLVFPFLEIFIILFFMTSLAAAAGTLLAYGITEHRPGPAVVGVALLVLLVAFGLFVLWLLRRLYGAADRLGLSYVGSSRPPPQAGPEGRLARWLRHVERGFWVRPDGVVLQLMEPHRTDHYLRSGFNLQQALRATNPDLLRHSHQAEPDGLENKASGQTQPHPFEGAADPVPDGAQAPPCIQAVSRNSCSGRGHTSRVQPQEGVMQQGKKRLGGGCGPGAVVVGLAPAAVTGSQPQPPVRTTLSMMRERAWGSFTSKSPAVSGGGRGGGVSAASTGGTSNNYRPTSAALPGVKGAPIAESVLDNAVSRSGGSVDKSSARHLLSAGSAYAGITEPGCTDTLTVFEEASDVGEYSYTDANADADVNVSGGNFDESSYSDPSNHVSTYFLPLQPAQLPPLKSLPPPPPPPPLPPPPPPRPVLLPPLDLHSRASSIAIIPLYRESVPGSQRGPTSIRSGSCSARPSLHGGVRASGSGARPEEHLAWMPSGNGTASGQVAPPPLMSEDSRESKWRPAFSMDDDSEGDDADCSDAGIDRDVPGAVITPKPTVPTMDGASERPRSAAALPLATPATSMPTTAVVVASPRPRSAAAAAAGPATVVGSQEEGTDSSRHPRNSPPNGYLPLPPPPSAASATHPRQPAAESETAIVSTPMTVTATAELEIEEAIKPATEPSLSRRIVHQLSGLGPVCCSCDVSVMCCTRGYGFNSAAAAELEKAADAACGRREAPSTPPLATECSNTAPSSIQQLELYERYGQLFEEMKGRRFYAVTFQVAIVCNAVIPAVLLGAQKGAQMEPYSTATRGTIIALLVCKALFAFYMTLALPYSNVVTMGAELFCAWLEAAVCACLVGLQWIHRSEPSLSDAMLGCEITVFALQIVRVALTTVMPTILAIHEEGCNLGWGWGCCGPPVATAPPQQPPAPSKAAVTAGGSIKQSA